MRVHGDKVIRRRKGVAGLTHYPEAKPLLERDFYFVPKSIDGDRVNDYYNLVLACPKCNLAKSDKWPTEDAQRPNNGTVGFVDPATEEFDEHLERNDQGYVVGKTLVGKNMCRMLHVYGRQAFG